MSIRNEKEFGWRGFYIFYDHYFFPGLFPLPPLLVICRLHFKLSMACVRLLKI